MSELKPLPCPFCGDTPKLCGSDNHKLLIGWFVVCDGCGASQKIIGEDDSGAAAIEAWNRRAQPAQAGQVLTDDALWELWNAQGCDDMNQSEAISFARAIEQAVLAKRVPQWLPISTAPKGQRVMVWVADKEAGENIAFAKVWFYADGTLGGGAEGFNGQWDLTHWMPLPPPPGIVGEKGGA